MDAMKLEGGTCDVVVETYQAGLLVEVKRLVAGWKKERAASKRYSAGWHFADGALAALEDIRRHVTPPKLRKVRKSRAKGRA